MPTNLSKPKGWYSRGYLPHYDGGEITQFITIRLADSLPQNILERWRDEIARKRITEATLRRRVEHFLDQGYGSCALKDVRVAAIVQENLLHFDTVKYRLMTWVIMPNHIHFMARPLAGYSLADIAHSNKSYTAHESNKILGRSGRFWFPEIFDRRIRSFEHFEKTFDYVENNPVKAGLCKKPKDWIFSSAYFRRNERR